jgi:multimeric flavodoxin WrbA
MKTLQKKEVPEKSFEEVQDNKESRLKILAICGSPRKGNTYKVLKSIKSTYPNIDFKILRLSKMDLRPCKGCYICVLNGEEHCPLKDDRDLIIEKIYAADGVIFASPVYLNHVSSLIKKMFERLGYMSHRPRFYDKFAMVLSVCKGFGTKPANEYIDNIVNSWGFNVVSSLGLQFSTESEKEEIYNFKQMFDAFNIFMDRIKKGERTPPTMANLVMFNLFKYVSETYKDKFKADYAYYKDKTNYPYDGQINVLKKMLAKRYVQKFAHDVAVHR